MQSGRRFAVPIGFPDTGPDLEKAEMQGQGNDRSLITVHIIENNRRALACAHEL
jgi:hypothetical protein